MDDPQKARQLKQTIKMQTTDAPKSKDEVAIFAQAVHDAKAIVDLLQVDDQIRNFLIKVSSKTATILDLNQSVLDWITKHKLQSRIKVTFDILNNWYSKECFPKEAFFVIKHFYELYKILQNHFSIIIPERRSALMNPFLSNHSC